MLLSFTAHAITAYFQFISDRKSVIPLNLQSGKPVFTNESKILITGVAVRSILSMVENVGMKAENHEKAKST